MEAIVGATTSWRHVDGDQDDGDHGVMPVTMEKEHLEKEEVAGEEEMEWRRGAEE